MNIEIITPNDGWILHRMADKLAERIPGVKVVAKPSNTADITYFLHYHMYQPVTTRTAAFFTHREPEGHPLHDRWSQVAAKVDLCISMSDFYKDQLPPEKTVVILPGVDDRFQPRRLRVGVACQWAHGNEYRKGKDLIDRLQAECADWIDLRLTNGEVADGDMVAWYQNLDVYLVASRIEGGPIPLIEAIACGVPVLTPAVGIAGSVYRLNENIEYYPTGDYGLMVGSLWLMYQRRVGESKDLQQPPKWAKPDGKLRHHDTFMFRYSWDRFADKHQAQFEKLLKAEAVT